MPITDNPESMAEAVRLMRAVRDARESLDESMHEHAILKSQIKVVAERSTALSEAHGRAIAALAAYAQRHPFATG